MQLNLERTERLIGRQQCDILRKATVMVFGIGGVGSYCVEALARSGIGTLILVDRDTVSESNLNRQLIALQNTVGREKTAVAKERILSINPQAKVYTYPLFFSEGTKDLIDFSSCDYIIDAIDTVTSKLLLVEIAAEKNIPIISSMGTGNKLDPTAFEVSDIYKTSMCPLAKVMRHELRKRGIRHLQVVYSKEPPVTPKDDTQDFRTPASISFVPGTAGLIMAGQCIKDLINRSN